MSLNAKDLEPRELANVHNTAVSAATDILSSTIAPSSGTPAKLAVLFRVQVAMNTAGVFSARITKSSTTVGVNFNSGANLVADSVYIFDLLVHNGDTVNFRHSVEATMLVLRVQEIPVGVS